MYFVLVRLLICILKVCSAIDVVELNTDTNYFFLLNHQLQMETLQSRLDAEFLLSHMCSVKFKEWIVVLATLLRRSEVWLTSLYELHERWFPFTFAAYSPLWANFKIYLFWESLLLVVKLTQVSFYYFCSGLVWFISAWFALVESIQHYFKGKSNMSVLGYS